MRMGYLLKIMSEDYYETIGRILNNLFSQNKDPFDVIEKDPVNVAGRRDSEFSGGEKIQGIHKLNQSRNMKGMDAPKKNILQTNFQKIEFPKIAVPKYLIEDFLTLKLPPGSSLEECKAAWKNLLKRYHPDLQNSAGIHDSEVVIRINNSFRRIEKWFASCNG